jgi:hypothetical protein
MANNHPCTGKSRDQRRTGTLWEGRFSDIEEDLAR